MNVTVRTIIQLANYRVHDYGVCIYTQSMDALINERYESGALFYNLCWFSWSILFFALFWKLRKAVDKSDGVVT